MIAASTGRGLAPLRYRPHLGDQEEEAPCLNSHKSATQASTVLGPLCVCCPVLPGPSSLPQALLTLKPDQLSARLPGWQPRPGRGRGRPHRWVLWDWCFLHSRGNSDFGLSGSPGSMSLCQWLTAQKWGPYSLLPTASAQLPSLPHGSANVY